MAFEAILLGSVLVELRFTVSPRQGLAKQSVKILQIAYILSTIKKASSYFICFLILLSKQIYHFIIINLRNIHL